MFARCSMLDDLITDEVKALFMAEPPEYVASDDLSWLNDLIVPGYWPGYKHKRRVRMAYAPPLSGVPGRTCHQVQ